MGLVEITGDKHSQGLGPAVIISPVFVKAAEWKQAAVKKPARQGGRKRGKEGGGQICCDIKWKAYYSLGTGFRGCNSCENSWEVSRILVFSAGVWEYWGWMTLCNFTTCPQMGKTAEGQGVVVVVVCVGGWCWWDNGNMNTLGLLIYQNVKVLCHTYKSTFCPLLVKKIMSRLFLPLVAEEKFELLGHSWHSLCTDLHTFLAWVHMALHSTLTHTHTHVFELILPVHTLTSDSLIPTAIGLG